MLTPAKMLTPVNTGKSKYLFSLKLKIPSQNLFDSMS